MQTRRLLLIPQTIKHMNKKLLKRADILEWLEITPATYRKWLESGLLRPVKLRGISKKWFRRSDIVKTLQLEQTP